LEELEIFYEDKEALKASSNKRLSVVISADGLCSFIHSRNQILLVQRDKPLLSDQAFGTYLRNAYAYYKLTSIKVFVDDYRFSIVPRHLGDSQLIKAQLSTNFKFDESDFLGTTLVDEVKIYFVKSKLCFGALDPNVAINKEDHFISLILRKGLAERDINYCFFLNKSFYFLQKANNKIILATRYEYSHENDVLYHLQMVHNHVQPIQDITLAGFISNESSIVSLLRSYFTNVTVASSNVAERFDIVIDS
jgi:hypothetical protein